MGNSDDPRLIFQYEFDKSAQLEAKSRCYKSDVQVVLNNGNSYIVHFYTCGRLSQDLEEGMKFGYEFIADPGLIILPEITLENMQSAVNKLEKQGFFNYFVPISPDQVIPPPA